MESQKCPLCGKIAKFKLPPYGTANKCFSCPDCLNFVISPKAEKYVIDSPEKKRIDLSNKSKAAEQGLILHIWQKEIDGDVHIMSKYEPEGKWF